MRVRALGWICGLIAASGTIEAVALGQSTWGGGAKPAPAASAPDAGPTYSTWGRSKEPAPQPAPDAATPLSTWGGGAKHAVIPGEILDAGIDATLPPRVSATPDAAVPAAEPDAGDDGGWAPSDVGFGIGLRGGYGVPFGMANGAGLYSIAQGVIPLEAEAGFFLNTHLYVGGYFLYGFGMGNVQNDYCSGVDEECSVTLIRFGLVAHYHFKPDNWLDPWVGLGLGYEIVNIEQTDTPDDTQGVASALQGVDVTVEAGLDFKPLRYLGLGPYAELATGPYIGTETFGWHGWVSFGARFRTNL
ncbi:MAG: hypothetical protein ACLQBL_00360 [Polyangiaceae bacterium]|jgi:hypothetical protein